MTEPGTAVDGPHSLVVVGAAAGTGRWLVDHLLPQRPWDAVTLVDTEAALAGLSSAFAGVPLPVHRARIVATDDAPVLLDRAGGRIVLDGEGLVLCLAVPLHALPAVSAWAAPLVAQGAAVCAVSAMQGSTVAELRRQLPGATVYGLHTLFDATARTADGQTFLILPDEATPGSTAHHWLADLVEDAGGIAELVPTAAHDQAMAYVQALTHQVLVAFVDTVTSSGIDLEELWKLRTPLFESLFGLGVRAIAEPQQATLAEIQVSVAGARVAGELRGALQALAAVVGAGDATAVEATIAGVRDRFSGALFDTVASTARSAVSATQANRAELARHRRLGTLVGIRSLARPESLRVGRITAVTPVSVTLREEMVGSPGKAALLGGPGERNAARAGINGKVTDTEFGLGHVELVLGDELEQALDAWLASIRRDIRFLVPESVAGKGVLAIVAGHAGVSDATLISEVVRTGQRSVVVRVMIRADHDVDDMAEALRAQVQATYVWPHGIILAAEAIDRVHYLGPAGTFSEGAADQAMESAGLQGAESLAHDGFPSVLAAIGPGSLGIVPISSSASGLVSRSVRALLDHPDHLVAGGVVDVAVRIDAYVGEGRQLEELRGAKVYSHPQALGQCGGFIKRWGLEPVPCSSTTEALAVVAQHREGAVALARADATTGPALKVAEREVDDLSGSITRFLILGRPDTFGALEGGWDPTLRHIWVAEDARLLLETMVTSGPGFDELLTAEDGGGLWITSRAVAPVNRPGLRYLGRAPWSPRTPVVRVEVAVPTA